MVGVAAGAALAATTPTAAAPAQSVTGTVGPGFTIVLKKGGQKVAKLKAHTPYRFVISDRSTIHDFRVA